MASGYHGYQAQHVCLTFYVFTLFLDLEYFSEICLDLNFFDIILFFKGERQDGRERTNSEEVVNSEMKPNSKKTWIYKKNFQMKEFEQFTKLIDIK